MSDIHFGVIERKQYWEKWRENQFTTTNDNLRISEEWT